MKDLESEFPDLWSENCLRPYLGEVKRRHGVVETLALPSMRDLPPVQIETLFVPPLLAETTVSADTDPDVWPAGRALLSELQDFRQLVVLGDPGGGKTTLSNWLAWRLASGLNSPLPVVLKNRVPIPCVLRDMPLSLFTTDISLVDLAHSVSEKLLGARNNSLLKDALATRVNIGAYVLILDGVDEIPLNHRQVVAGWIRAASEQGGCVLATSRIVGYEDAPVDGIETNAGPGSNIKFSDKNFNGKYTSGSSYIQKKISSSFRTVEHVDFKESIKWAHIRYLMPFDQGRIASFAENWYRQRCMTQQEAAQKTTDLLAALSQSEVTQKLARTPNLLSLMAIVHRERAHLPDGKALLYEEIVNAYINTIDKQRKIEPGDTLAQYGWKDRKAWLSYVGFKMQLTRGTETSRDAGILADEADVEHWLTEAMAVSGVPLPHQAAKTFLNWVARRSGLLLPRGEARYAFVHLSFQEYFCACYLDTCIVRPAFIRNALPPDADVTKKKLADWSSDRHWFETLVFLFELLSAERDSEWVDDLVRIIFGDEISEFAPYDRAGELASRIIKNKHVKISSHYRDGLAAGLGSIAISIWAGESYGPDSGILASLIDAGYAAVIGSVPVVSGKADSTLLQGKCFADIAEVVDPGSIRILIIERKFVTPQVLELFSNVMYMRMNDVDVEDVSFLKSMKRLKVLQLISLQISNVEPLVELKELNHLELHNMGVDSLAPLSRLANINTLELHDLDVSDLTPISRLKKIVYLSLEGLQIDSIAPLSLLKDLRTLYLVGLPLMDVSPIASLKNLNYLKIDATPIKEFAFLKGLKSLVNLDLRRMTIPDLTGVASIKWLDSLYLIGCDVVSLSPLQKLVELRGLGLMHLKVSDMSFVSKLKHLNTCYISGVEVSDLAPFASLKNLLSLSIEAEHVPSLEPLATCEGLRFLDIDCKSSVDVLPLKKLKKLHDIQLKSSSVKNAHVFEEVEGVNFHWDEQP